MTIEAVKPQLNYSINEACLILGMSRKTLYSHRKRGDVKYYLRKTDKAVRIRGSEILKFYNS